MPAYKKHSAFLKVTEGHSGKSRKSTPILLVQWGRLRKSAKQMHCLFKSIFKHTNIIHWQHLFVCLHRFCHSASQEIVQHELCTPEFPNICHYKHYTYLFSMKTNCHLQQKHQEIIINAAVEHFLQLTHEHKKSKPSSWSLLHNETWIFQSNCLVSSQFLCTDAVKFQPLGITPLSNHIHFRPCFLTTDLLIIPQRLLAFFMPSTVNDLTYAQSCPRAGKRKKGKSKFH